jgi:AraC-like DNA-binding protein
MHFSRLTELSSRYVLEGKHEVPVMPRLSVFCRRAPSQTEAHMYEPALCLILQGRKTARIGDQLADVGARDALIISHDLPVVARITQASAREPYLAVILSLDMQLLHSLHDQVAEALVPMATGKSMAVGSAESAWLASVIRYFELADHRLDAEVLGPSMLREIHYRVLISPLGGMLRNLLVTDSHASRVAKAMRMLRAEYRVPLSVSALAKIAGMGVSSFHERFKAVTGTTPLQYQKDLRLIEAHALLTAQSHTVSDAAYAVGYESPSHFSRDYRKKFGVPPSRGASATHPALQSANADDVNGQQRRPSTKASARRAG